MSKSETYHWRLTPELKAQIEAAAAASGTSISVLLERMARAWLSEERRGATPQATLESPQPASLQRQRAEFEAFMDEIASDGDGLPATNQRVRDLMTEQLEPDRGKRRSG